MRLPHRVTLDLSELLKVVEKEQNVETELPRSNCACQIWKRETSALVEVNTIAETLQNSKQKPSWFFKLP